MHLKQISLHKSKTGSNILKCSELQLKIVNVFFFLLLLTVNIVFNDIHKQHTVIYMLCCRPVSWHLIVYRPLVICECVLEPTL